MAGSPEELKRLLAAIGDSMATDSLNYIVDLEKENVQLRADLQKEQLRNFAQQNKKGPAKEEDPDFGLKHGADLVGGRLHRAGGHGSHGGNHK